MRDNTILYLTIGAGIMLLLFSLFDRDEEIKIETKLKAGEETVRKIGKLETIEEVKVKADTKRVREEGEEELRDKSTIVASAPFQISTRDSMTLEGEIEYREKENEFNFKEMVFRTYETVKFRVDTLERTKTVYVDEPFYKNLFFWTTLILLTVIYFLVG